MCAPGSKQWRKVSRYLRLFSAMIFVAYYVNFFIYSEIAYLLRGSIPQYAPAQWRMTAEAADEVTGVQEYVASLATHDLCCADAVHAVAAFDLASPYVHDIATGIVDWSSFLSPAQHHIWYLVHSTPLSWIYLPAPHSLPLPIVQVMPPTIHLSAGLRGGGKRALSRSVAAGSGGGDGPNRSASAAQPGASSSGMRILKRPALAMTHPRDNQTHLAPRGPILWKLAFSTTDALAKDTLWRATCTVRML